MRHKKSYDKSVYLAFALIMQFGINMLVPILLLFLLGMYLDTRFGTSYWMIILFILGVVVGGNNVYRMAKRIYGTKKCGEDLGDKEMQNDKNSKKD